MQTVKKIFASLFLVLLLSATAQAASLTLTWQDNSSAESGFEVERCLGLNCSTFALLATVAANVTTYIDNTLAEIQTASYRVRAIATGGIVSTYSNVGTSTSKINAPTNLVVQ
jgi:hypothetical protein